MAKWNTGTVVAVGLGAMFFGLGLGGRIMAQYCAQVCPEVLNINRNQRRRAQGRRRGVAIGAGATTHDRRAHRGVTAWAPQIRM